MIDVFGIEAGDTPGGVRALAGIGGVLTSAVLEFALARGGACAVGLAACARLFAGAAIAGLVTAPQLWLPTGVVLGAASRLSR